MEFFYQFDVGDRVDVFCMSEAKLISILNSENQDLGDESLVVLNRFIWENDIVSELLPYLENLGLYTSPAYVQFGQLLLL